jgi:hypothetical protein
MTYVADAQVPAFNAMYELYDPCTVMFFFRNKHIMIDLGTGNNNKINWAMTDKQEFIDIVETIYKGARKGRGLVVSPKGGDPMFLSCPCLPMWFVWLCIRFGCDAPRDSCRCAHGSC